MSKWFKSKEEKEREREIERQVDEEMSFFNPNWENEKIDIEIREKLRKNEIRRKRRNVFFFNIKYIFYIPLISIFRAFNFLLEIALTISVIAFVVIIIQAAITLLDHKELAWHIINWVIFAAPFAISLVSFIFQFLIMKMEDALGFE